MELNMNKIFLCGRAIFTSKYLFLFITLFFLMTTSCQSQEQPFTFSLSFSNAQGLTSGDPVLYNGVHIGQVNNISFNSSGHVLVQVTIKDQYTSQIYQEALFIIEDQDQIEGSGSGKKIVLKDTPKPHTPIKNGDRLEGSEDSFGQVIESLKQAQDKALAAAKDLSGHIESLTTELQESPEVRDFYQSLKELADKSKILAQEEYQKFKKNQLPKIKEKAQKLKETIERNFNQQTAQKFWEDFMSWLEKTEQESTQQI